jgi:hypothetical protein
MSAHEEFKEYLTTFLTTNSGVVMMIVDYNNGAGYYLDTITPSPREICEKNRIRNRDDMYRYVNERVRESQNIMNMGLPSFWHDLREAAYLAACFAVVNCIRTGWVVEKQYHCNKTQEMQFTV